ncbi:tetratricopeptide repeat protein [Endozoicomonas sp. G2_2]|uniref:tetratricopeptide repeat protein n=1 Tax=Endozoicomonas sp. G2_2 TaxID=2821092 RepID=UPI001ADB500E|nr:tetratricopeptide repeat protein [Endozoicomonas sp. G2_2]MBO9470769.1 tetratricopeptide repeat protein [Endozoicomonas sp. G2_2]
MGSLSTLGRNIFNEPNISADWLSRVVSGNSAYLDPTTRAGVAYADGLNAYARGDYERARQRIEAALQTAAGTPDYKAGMVAVEAAAGNIDIAESILDDLNEAELKYPEPTRIVARLRYLTHAAHRFSPRVQLDEFNELLDRMEPVFAGNSTAIAGALVGRARALAALERWDEAHRSFLDALAITETIQHSYSTWWRQTLVPALGRAARKAGHCDTEISRLENSLQMQTLMQKYSALDAEIAIEAVRCLKVLDRANDTMPYIKALRAARQNGVLTDPQKASLAELNISSSA